jgi:hypothetical protein
MSEHAPTPWLIKPLSYDDWGWVRDANGRLACLARGADDKDPDQHRRDKTDPYQANAAFIVEAVNSHERLKADLDASRDVVKMLEGEVRDNAARLESARKALEPFAAFADPRNVIPPDIILTAGSPMARKQITMADCYAARAALTEIAQMREPVIT